VLVPVHPVFLMLNECSAGSRWSFLLTKLLDLWNAFKVGNDLELCVYRIEIVTVRAGSLSSRVIFIYLQRDAECDGWLLLFSLQNLRTILGQFTAYYHTAHTARSHSRTCACACACACGRIGS
jgi:hypothetical protein